MNCWLCHFIDSKGAKNETLMKAPLLNLPTRKIKHLALHKLTEKKMKKTTSCYRRINITFERT